ncbi:MAG TPA: hypothetical protein DDW30_02390 [Clostridiales bacterium]|nr:hypothetical protein [Clostridiales bacterium]
MSKYKPLWEFIQSCGERVLTLSFSEMERASGVPIDHSFLRYKQELAEYGYRVGKISLKAQTVEFVKAE